jgi:hypothetical protein
VPIGKHFEKSTAAIHELQGQEGNLASMSGIFTLRAKQSAGTKHARASVGAARVSRT